MTFSLGYDISPQNPLPNYGFNVQNANFGYPLSPVSGGFNAAGGAYRQSPSGSIRALTQDTFKKNSAISNHKANDKKHILIGLGAFAAGVLSAKFAVKGLFKLAKTPFKIAAKTLKLPINWCKSLFKK